MAYGDQPTITVDGIEIPLLGFGTWQLEPDDEAMLNNPDNYYYVDDQGNLIEPGAGTSGGQPVSGQDSLPGNGSPNPGPNSGLVPVNPPAANDDFLDQATGRNNNRPRDPAPPILIPPRDPQPSRPSAGQSGQRPATGQ